MCLENFFLYPKLYILLLFVYWSITRFYYTIVGRIVVELSEKKKILGSNLSKFFCSNMFCKKSSVKIYRCRSAAIGWFIQCEKRSFLNHFVGLCWPFPISFINLPVFPSTIFHLLLSILLDFLPNIWRQIWHAWT